MKRLCYCASGFHLARDYTIGLVAARTAQGLEVEHLYPGLGHGRPRTGQAGDGARLHIPSGNPGCAFPERHACALEAASAYLQCAGGYGSGRWGIGVAVGAAGAEDGLRRLADDRYGLRPDLKREDLAPRTLSSFVTPVFLRQIWPSLPWPF